MTNMSIDGIDTISKTSVLLKKILNTEINDPEKSAFTEDMRGLITRSRKDFTVISWRTTAI